MSDPEGYRTLINALQALVKAEPDKVPEILAFILAGRPFRAFLKDPEEMERILEMARGFVAASKQPVTHAPPPPAVQGVTKLAVASGKGVTVVRRVSGS